MQLLRKREFLLSLYIAKIDELYFAQIKSKQGDAPFSQAEVHDLSQYRITSAFLASLLLFLLQLPNAVGQLAPEVARVGYADTIFVNGKIVSMDDASTSTDVGNVYQAIAVKRDKIMKLGNAAEVRAMAGPDTKVFDLRGRTLLPAIVEPHSHIFGSITQYLDRFGFKYPPHGIIVSRTADRDLEKTQAIM